MGQECEHLGVRASRRRVVLEFDAHQAVRCFLLSQASMQKVFSMNRLQLLEVSDEYHEWAGGEFAKRCLQALPYVPIDLADLIQNDEVVLPETTWRIISSISLSRETLNAGWMVSMVIWLLGGNRNLSGWS